jgi:AraC-like DNA-binding protein
MREQKPYLDPDLTLSRLSRKMGVPTKTLSSTINQQTGGNVSRYINEARIRAAQDFILRGETVTNAMLMSGFNTKSNFNREFLRVAGRNPSAWLAENRPADPS